MKLLVSTQAAERLGITRFHVLRLAREGRIESTKLPGKRGQYLFDPDYIDALADERKGAAK